MEYYHWKPQLNSISNIPKIIWTFWDKDHIPETVRKCINTWYVHNPDHVINVVTKSTLKRFLPDIDIFKMKMAITSQIKSDLVRIHLLERYGGIWCDATIMLTGPLNYEFRTEEFIGYYVNALTINPKYPVIENWFFACPPHSEFIKKWKDIFVKINDFDCIIHYIRFIRKHDVDLDNIDRLLILVYYLTMHAAVQYVIQKQMTEEDIKTKLFLEKAEDGPYKHLAEHHWDVYSGIKSLCDYPEKRSKIIKFRRRERYVISISPELSNCLFV